MVKRSIYEAVGGFEEKLAVAFNDVDFCLKVRKEGYLVVYQPRVEAYHYESKSRGSEEFPGKSGSASDGDRIYAESLDRHFKER